MCTLSLVPSGKMNNGFVLTSNRDEDVKRENFPPAQEHYKESSMFFPKDKVAGGTWIGVSEHKRAVCLINGAFKKHERKATYRKSRGIVVKDFLAIIGKTKST